MYTILTVFESCKKTETPQSLQTDPGGPAQFVGSAKCQSCHQNEYADWQLSDHFRAMQVPFDSTVVGDFNNTTYVADGVTNRFFKKDGKFFINTQGDDGKNHDYEVAYTFGYFPLQQYLIAFPGGRLQATRVSWDSRNKKWFHQYSGQKFHHGDWLHWTGNAQNWNTMCASCHSTDLQKHYNFTSDSYATTWKEINVSCESCHGAGSKHVQFIQSENYKNGDSIHNSGLLYAHQTNPQLQLNTCAPCHARKAEVSQNYIHSGEILDDLIPQLISDEFYFADGQIREEDYEYGSFTQSKMFHNNVRCSNCHNPHSGKLKMVGNSLCLSCHKPTYDTKEHHFHAVNSEGAQCINCHMTTRTFMGTDVRRDHSFRVPRPDQSLAYGTPNACTSCHKNQSATWAMKKIQERYGAKRAYHFSDDLLPGSLRNEKSEKHLVKLLADTTQPEIARATAAFYLGSIQTQTSAAALIKSLSDKKALVRHQVVRSLENFPPQIWVQPAQQALRDKVRAVRIAAADLYHQLPPEAIPASVRTAYQAADGENQKYLRYQTDFSVGNVMLADYELQGGDQLGAIQHYIRGLKKDSLMNYARLNLAAAYNTVGKNSDALKVLDDASRIDPSNGRIFYNRALLKYELQDLPGAVGDFEKSIRLGEGVPGLYYNYGLLLQQQKKNREAEKIFIRGLNLNPDAVTIHYALAYLYMTENDRSKAGAHVLFLYRVAPDNPDYQGLFNAFGLNQ